MPTESAAGLDGWYPKDMALLSDKALEKLVDMLNAIEEGAEWPKHMHFTRAVMLPKDENNTQDPLAYRILKVSSAIYRKWATTRNKKLENWILTWDDQALYAGVPGKGAQDAWYTSAICNEMQRINGYQIAGGSIDVYKCFDQINGHLLKELAIKAGMPKRIYDPYFRYIENMQSCFQVGKRIGKPAKDRCSIPQGCPFSMTMIGLITIPWINMMKEKNIAPRVLADDLMFSAYGEGHRANACDAMNTSIDYFEAIGVKDAHNKCFMFATDAHTRNHFRNCNWKTKGI